MQVVTFQHGIAICGEFPKPEVINAIKEYKKDDPILLSIIDPPYGKVTKESWDNIGEKELVRKLIEVCKEIEALQPFGSALYVWGGIGKPKYRPFYRFLIEIEHTSGWQLANHITWKKKRAYGVQHNYLFTREELAYLVKGAIENPLIFNIPLLDEKRPYSGYNPKYPAKSEFYRRSNVWTDITEIFRGKLVEAQKPVRVIKIPIEVHTNPGNIVLDTYAGSGTTAVAAILLNRRFIIVERDESTFKIALDRIVQAYKDRANAM